MKDDVVMRLLREVKAGKVSIEDAGVALEDAALTEEAFDAAVNHGVFNEVKPGTIVRASLALWRFLANHNGRPVGNSMDPLLGWRIGLWAVSTVGSTIARVQPGYDAPYADNHGNRVPEICPARCSNSQTQEKQVHNESRYKFLEKV